MGGKGAPQILNKSLYPQYGSRNRIKTEQLILCIIWLFLVLMTTMIKVFIAVRWNKCK